MFTRQRAPGAKVSTMDCFNLKTEWLEVFLNQLAKGHVVIDD
jgi:hypothetical protein